MIHQDHRATSVAEPPMQAPQHPSHLGLLRLAGVHCNNNGIGGIEDVKLGGVHLFKRQALWKTNRRVHVSPCLYGDAGGAEDVAEHMLSGKPGEGPEPGCTPLPAVDLGNTWASQKQDAAGLQGPVHCGDSRVHVLNQVQSLGDHQTVESSLGQDARNGEVTDDRRFRIVRRDVKHVLLHNTGSELAAVGGIADLQGAAPNVARIRREERLDIVAIHGSSAAEAEIRADWAQTVEIPEADTPKRRRPPPARQTLKHEYHALWKSTFQASDQMTRC